MSSIPTRDRPRWQRVLWLVAGVLSLVVGVIGIVVPLLPTAPLVLLAAFCFSRGSERWEAWLLAHRRFGPMILDWSRPFVRTRTSWSERFDTSTRERMLCPDRITSGSSSAIVMPASSASRRGSRRRRSRGGALGSGGYARAPSVSDSRAAPHCGQSAPGAGVFFSVSLVAAPLWAVVPPGVPAMPSGGTAPE
jgi:hypothetical protein